MKAYKQYRGDYRTITARVTDTLNVASKLHFAVKPPEKIQATDATDANAVIKKDYTGANAVDNGDGTITFTIELNPPDTLNVAPGVYRGECQYINAAGKPSTYDSFDFILEADINQRTV